MLRTLLRTKLHRPRVEHPQVARPDLVQRIEAGIRADTTLIVAPAGYGKTTLVSQWAARTQVPVAWYAIDETDNDLPQFLSYVLLAIQTQFPATGIELRGMLERATLPDSVRLAELLTTVIDSLPQAFVLVLDGYHYVNEPAIHQLLSDLLRHPSVKLQLLITSRSQPPLALSRLRSSRRLLELSVQDLSFTHTEAAELLAQVWSADCTGATVEALLARTQGWAAGLYLAALALSSKHQQAAFLSDPSQKLGFTADYLFEQVLLQQPPLVRDFLLKASIAEHLSPGLTAAVMGNERDHTGISLARLAQAGLFLQALDDTKDGSEEWYTFHPLFRDMLQLQLQVLLPAREIAVLHRRASAWFCRQGLFDDALRHAFAAGDTALAVQIVIDHGTSWLGRTPWRTIQRRLNQFPSDLLDGHPWLLMMRAHILVLQFKWDVLLPLLMRAEQCLIDGNYTLTSAQEDRLRSYLDAVWAVHWSTAANAKQAIEAARQALPGLAETHYYARGVLLLALTLSLQASGQAALAEPMLAAALAQAELSTLGSAALLRPLLCLMSLHFAEGNIGLAAQVAQMLLRRATETNSWFDLQTAHLALGFAAYETNDLAAAVEHFRHGADLRHAGNVRAGHECLVGLVLSYHALRRTDVVKATLAQLADYHADVGSSVLAAEAISLQRRCGMLGAGNGDLRRRSVSVHMSIWFGWLEVPAFTEVRLALAAGQGRNLAPIESALRHLWEVAVELNKPTYQAALLALRAVLQQQMGQKGAALETLRQALVIGEEHGYVRSLVDAGPQLEPLLAELAIMQPSAYLERVRAALDIRPKVQGGKDGMMPMTRLAVPLTRREREVLALLGQYRTDREIAETLVISPLTVRTHIENLSSKLSANGRRAIVNRARETGLLA